MKVEHLYKVYGRGTTAPIYVAAECQQQAVEMAATMYNIEDSYQLAVDYVSEVLTKTPQNYETEESVSQRSDKRMPAVGVYAQVRTDGAQDEE